MFFIAFSIGLFNNVIQISFSATGSTNIVRVGGDNSLDNAYQNFKSNMSPEVNRMILESTPNIKDVVVYDQATGNKYFDVIDVTTNQSVPNVPVRDAMFVEDCTIDTRNRIARNINLNETYPLIILNEGKPFDISENKHTPEPSRRSRKKQADNGIPCSVLSTNYENAKET